MPHIPMWRYPLGSGREFTAEVKLVVPLLKWDCVPHHRGDSRSSDGDGRVDVEVLSSEIAWPTSRPSAHGCQTIQNQYNSQLPIKHWHACLCNQP